MSDLIIILIIIIVIVYMFHNLASSLISLPGNILSNLFGSGSAAVSSTIGGLKFWNINPEEVARQRRLRLLKLFIIIVLIVSLVLYIYKYKYKYKV